MLPPIRATSCAACCLPYLRPPNGAQWVCHQTQHDPNGTCLLLHARDGLLQPAAQDAAGRTAVQVAAAAGHVEVVALVLESGQAQSGKGLTALHLAVQQGRDALVGDLLKLSGVVPNARDSDGLTALHWAASKGTLWIHQILVGEGVERPTAPMRI